MNKITKENFNYESVMTLVDKVGDSEIVKCEQNKYILIETKSVKPFQALFIYSKNDARWCFCKKNSELSVSFYHNYVTSHNGKQFVLFDFTKEYPNPKSIIAFTTWDGKVSHAYTLDNYSLDRKFYDISFSEFMNLVWNI